MVYDYKKIREEFCLNINEKIDDAKRYLENMNTEDGTLRYNIENYWVTLTDLLGEPMWPMDEDWNTKEGVERLIAVMESIIGKNDYLQTYGDWTDDGERDTEDYLVTKDDTLTWGQIWRENLEWFSNYANDKVNRNHELYVGEKVYDNDMQLVCEIVSIDGDKVRVSQEKYVEHNKSNFDLDCEEDGMEWDADANSLYQFVPNMYDSRIEMPICYEHMMSIDYPYFSPYLYENLYEFEVEKA